MSFFEPKLNNILWPTTYAPDEITLASEVLMIKSPFLLYQNKRKLFRYSHVKNS